MSGLNRIPSPEEVMEDARQKTASSKQVKDIIDNIYKKIKTDGWGSQEILSDELPNQSREILEGLGYVVEPSDKKNYVFIGVAPAPNYAIDGGISGAYNYLKTGVEAHNYARKWRLANEEADRIITTLKTQYMATGEASIRVKEPKKVDYLCETFEFHGWKVDYIDGAVFVGFPHELRK